MSECEELCELERELRSEMESLAEKGDIDGASLLAVGVFLAVLRRVQLGCIDAEEPCYPERFK